MLTFKAGRAVSGICSRLYTSLGLDQFFFAKPGHKPKLPQRYSTRLKSSPPNRPTHADTPPTYLQEGSYDMALYFMVMVLGVSLRAVGGCWKIQPIPRGGQFYTKQ